MCRLRIYAILLFYTEIFLGILLVYHKEEFCQQDSISKNHCLNVVHSAETILKKSFAEILAVKAFSRYCSFVELRKSRQIFMVK